MPVRVEMKSTTPASKEIFNGPYSVNTQPGWKQLLYLGY